MRAGTRGLYGFEAQAGRSAFGDRWGPQKPDGKGDPALRGEAVAQWMRLGAGYGDARLSVRYMDLGVTDSAWGGTAVFDEVRAGI